MIKVTCTAGCIPLAEWPRVARPHLWAIDGNHPNGKVMLSYGNNTVPLIFLDGAWRDLWKSDELNPDGMNVIAQSTWMTLLCPHG